MRLDRTTPLLGRSRLVRSFAASEAAFVASGQAAGLVFGLVASVVAARELGPAGRGVLSLCLLLPALLSLFLGFGAAIANVYLVGAGEYTPRQVTQITAALCLLGTIVGWGALALVSWIGVSSKLLPHVPAEDLALGMGMLPLSLAFNAYRAVLRGLLKIRATAVLDLIQSIATAAPLCVALLWLGAGVRGAIVATLLGTAGSLIALGWLLRGSGVSIRPALPRQPARRVVSFGVRGDLANLTQFFTYRFDSFLVNAVRTSTAVGLYTVGTRVAELVWVVPTSVALVIQPRAAAADSESLNVRTPRAFARVFAINCVSAVVLAVVGGFAIRVVYSTHFSDATRPMLLLLPGVILLGTASVLTADTTGRGHPGYNSINSLIGFVLTIGLDVLLIPRYGISGAAVASSLAYAVNFALAICFFLRVSRLTLPDFLSRARLRARPVQAGA